MGCGGSHEQPTVRFANNKDINRVQAKKQKAKQGEITPRGNGEPAQNGLSPRKIDLHDASSDSQGKANDVIYDEGVKDNSVKLDTTKAEENKVESTENQTTEIEENGRKEKHFDEIAQTDAVNEIGDSKNENETRSKEENVDSETVDIETVAAAITANRENESFTEKAAGSSELNPPAEGTLLEGKPSSPTEEIFPQTNADEYSKEDHDETIKPTIDMETYVALRLAGQNNDNKPPPMPIAPRMEIESNSLDDENVINLRDRMKMSSKPGMLSLEIMIYAG